MCVTIKVNDVWCDSMGELRSVIGDVPVSGGYTKPFIDEGCLCPVDLAALALVYDEYFPENDYDPMEKYFRTKNPAPFAAGAA